MKRVELNGADIEYVVRGSGAPVVFIHGAILSDGFVPVIEQTGVAENFQIVHYRRRGYAGSSRAVAGMTMQGWAGDCVALLNHLGIASAHVAGHSFGAGIALQMAIDAPGRVRKLNCLGRNGMGWSVVHVARLCGRARVRSRTVCCRMQKAVVELYGADPKNNPDYSRIISASAVNRLASLIDPQKVVYGGKSDPAARYLDPTILYPVSWSDKIMEDEIFGPLLPILTYSDLGKLLAKIKSMPKPLATYVFSRNQQMIDRVLGSVSFGGGAVNQTNVFLFIESMPYGGVGTAGLGNYYGKYGYDSLTHAKSVLISPPDVAINHLFPPYTKEKVQAMDQWFDY
jgi:pimeloyl-ACP methyl ester carboxylesterase